MKSSGSDQEIQNIDIWQNVVLITLPKCNSICKAVLGNIVNWVVPLGMKETSKMDRTWNNAAERLRKTESRIIWVEN